MLTVFVFPLALLGDLPASVDLSRGWRPCPVPPGPWSTSPPAPGACLSASPTLDWPTPGPDAVCNQGLIRRLKLRQGRTRACATSPRALLTAAAIVTLKVTLTGFGKKSGRTSPAAAGRDAAPGLCARRGPARPPPPGNAETGAARTSDCSAAAPSVCALPGAGTGSDLLDPPHLKSRVGRR